MYRNNRRSEEGKSKGVQHPLSSEDNTERLIEVGSWWRRRQRGGGGGCVGREEVEPEVMNVLCALRVAIRVHGVTSLCQVAIL